MNRAEKIFMYSGQSSQYYHMGYDLYTENEQFRKQLDRVHDVSLRVSGVPLKDVVFDANKRMSDVFDNQLLSSIAIYGMEIATTRFLYQKGVLPDLVLGSSLGLFAAATSAGCMSLEQGLDMIGKMVKVLQIHSEEGGMLAVLAQPGIYQSSVLLKEYSEISAFNSDDNFVLSVPNRYLQLVEDHLRELGLTYTRLAVQKAYHSRWIQEAEGAFMELFSCYDFRQPEIPVACCGRKGLLSELNARTFWQAVRAPICFKETVENLGSQTNPVFIDLGPSGSLATSLKYSLNGFDATKIFQTMSPGKRTGENVRHMYTALAA